MDLDFSFINLMLAFGAGIMSVASPCVLPVVPIIVTGTEQDHKHRPLLIVGGISLSFVGMGILTSLFGGAVGPWMPILEKIAGALVLLFGILMILDINLFKHFTFFYRFQTKSKGRWSGIIMGISLGLVWIPCVGPMLSGVLAMVATQGKVLHGIVMLLVYSAGFAVPMLIAGYSTQFFRSKINGVKKHPAMLRWISGLLLIGFGAWIMISGTMAIGQSI